jgi:uncharacterized protein (DUF2225 family)
MFIYFITINPLCYFDAFFKTFKHLPRGDATRPTTVREIGSLTDAGEKPAQDAFMGEGHHSENPVEI